MNAKQFRTAAGEFISASPSMGASQSTVSVRRTVCRLFGYYFENHDEPIEDAIRHWTVELFDGGVSTNSIRHYLETLRVFFKWCENRNMINGCPIKDDMVPKIKPRKYDLLTLDEIKKVLTEVPHFQRKETVARNRAIVLLVVGAGVRSNELRKLRLKDVDLDNSLIAVQNGKGDKYRKVPLPDFAKNAFADYLLSGARPATLPDDAPLFGNCSDEDGGSGKNSEWHEWSSAGICALIKRYVYQLTGHDGIGTHDLRHAFASVASYAGASTRDISLSMGHASEAITQKVYIDILDNEKAAENVNVRLNGFIQNP